MIAQTSIENIVSRQRKALAEHPSGHMREILAEMPYLSDKALIIGGIRHCGRSTLLLQMMRNEYTEAWYTDFSDPRLAGFDEGDCAKLSVLIAESGKGVLLFDKVDHVPSWKELIASLLAKGLKIIATVSLTGLARAKADASGAFVCKQAYPFSYTEFLEQTRRKGGETDVCDFMFRGGLPEQAKLPQPENVRRLYEEIISQDILIAKGVRDRTMLRRIALQLISASGQAVSANALRNKLKIKAVSSVSEHLCHLEQSGLVGFVPRFCDTPARQTVNPRKAYAADTAFISALSLSEQGADRETLFATMVYNHLRRYYPRICYTSEEGGCDFVVADEEHRICGCIQACYGDDYDSMQRKTEGLDAAMGQTGIARGVIVTLNQNDRISVRNGEIRIVDADYFLSENSLSG